MQKMIPQNYCELSLILTSILFGSLNNIMFGILLQFSHLINNFQTEGNK